MAVIRRSRRRPTAWRRRLPIIEREALAACLVETHEDRLARGLRLAAATVAADTDGGVAARFVYSDGETGVRVIEEIPDLQIDGFEVPA